MSADELRELAKTLIGIADGKPWQFRKSENFPDSQWVDAGMMADPARILKDGGEIRFKPWELGRTVNGHTLPDGAEWHRIDGWTEGMLPADPPHRPLMVGEKPLCDDEAKIDNYVQAQWQIITSGHPSGKCLENYHYRTTRPIPFALTLAQLADGWVPWNGGECPVEPESVPFYIIRKDGEISNDSTANRLAWEHRGSISDIVAYKPDPYGKFRQALADGRVIQCKDSYYKWVDLERPVFDSPPDQYRVKPEPQWLPLGKMDIHPGSILRKSDWPEGTWEAVLGTENGGIQWREGYESFDSLNLDWLINRPRHRDADGNPTLWEPCRKQAP